MTEPAPNPAPPPPDARPAPPTATAPKPAHRPVARSGSLLQNPTYLKGLAAVLLICCALAIYLGLRHRDTASKYMRREREYHATLWRIEHLRAAVARAERMGRMPDLDGKIVEDIRGQCDYLIDAATETMGMAPGLETPHRLRGQAYELRHAYEEAIGDYSESIRAHEQETARYRDQENVPFAIAFSHRGYLRVRMLLRLMLLDRDDAALQDGGFQDLRRANNSSKDTSGRTIGVVAMSLCKKEFEVTITQAETAIGLDPTDWRPLLWRGAARFNLKDDANALKDLTDAARLYPYGAEIHAWRARVLERLGRRDDAIRALANARLIDDRFYEASVLSGRFLAADGRFVDAEPQLHRATQLQPDDRAARLEHARVAIEAWIRGGRRDGPVLERGLESASAAIASDSRDAGAYALRARIHLARGAADSAITDATLALGITKSADAHKVRADAHAAKGDWSAAAADYAGAGDRREKARALGKARKFAEARAEYDELVKQDPSDASLALERGRTLLLSGDADAALTAADGILERSPSVTLARVLRAEALLAKDDVSGAILEASRAYDADPTQPDALVVRGRAFAKKGDKVNARRDLEKAKELAPAGRTAEIDALLKSLE